MSEKNLYWFPRAADIPMFPATSLNVQTSQVILTVLTHCAPEFCFTECVKGNLENRTIPAQTPLCIVHLRMHGLTIWPCLVCNDGHNMETNDTESRLARSSFTCRGDVLKKHLAFTKTKSFEYRMQQHSDYIRFLTSKCENPHQI
jgi:hypothetical protein